MAAVHLHPYRESLSRHDRRHAALDMLSDATGWVLATFGEWRRRNRDRAQLTTLDHRMLADIGLTEADRDFLANKPFWKE
jgi:uncharacterized protein YjiS (DUF1127 family)